MYIVSLSMDTSHHSCHNLMVQNMIVWRSRHMTLWIMSL